MSSSNNLKLKEVVVISRSVERFSIDGVPTCAAQFSKDSSERMTCHYLGATPSGSNFVCGYIPFVPVDVYDGANEYLEPHSECPIWNSIKTPTTGV